MGNKILIVILIVAVLVLGGLFGVKYFRNTEVVSDDVLPQVQEPEEVIVEEKKPQTWSGNQRSVAVVIDNVGSARPQAGLNKAKIVYEVTVEGGLTRLLAVFKNVDDMEMTIGPVRSARPVFLDYVLEHDSIFVHFGYSDRAKEEISSLKIENVNGLVAEKVAFWRTKEKSAPHNALTNMQKIWDYAEDKKYATTSDRESVLNYVVDEVVLENGDIANTVNVPYTSSYKVSFKYNAETKLYEKYINGKAYKDWISNEAITTKNIIITFARNYSTAEENGYGRQEIVNIGDLEGYYITNGNVIKITCSKTARGEQTVYKDLEGNEIEINEGNTYIEIVPLDTKVTFE